MFLAPCVLSGEVVRLEPMTRLHFDRLAEIAFDPGLWRYATSRMSRPEDLEQYMTEALEARDKGTALPFVTVDCASGRLIGSTRFANAEPAHRRVEIGWTFLAPRWQRTRANTEAKYLMLRHAFDALGCQRVELKADALNSPSRNAILRIGAREEGTLRSHMIVWDGRVRDTVYFSIIASEWPAVADRLLSKLNPSKTQSS